MDTLQECDEEDKNFFPMKVMTVNNGCGHLINYCGHQDNHCGLTFGHQHKIQGPSPGQRCTRKE
eukprot:10816929-Ditylum_brightwellii.AAC.1